MLENPAMTTSLLLEGVIEAVVWQDDRLAKPPWAVVWSIVLPVVPLNPIISIAQATQLVFVNVMLLETVGE